MKADARHERRRKQPQASATSSTLPQLPSRPYERIPVCPHAPAQLAPANRQRDRLSTHANDSATLLRCTVDWICLCALQRPRGCIMSDARHTAGPSRNRMHDGSASSAPAERQRALSCPNGVATPKRCAVRFSVSTKVLQHTQPTSSNPFPK